MPSLKNLTKASLRYKTNLNGGVAGKDLGLKLALVVAALDLEEAVVAPVGVPGVGAEPVVDAVL